MAKYTIELRHVCELNTRAEVEKWFCNYELTDYLTPKQIASISENTKWTKERLAEKIVDHYYMREIGSETPALFKLRAKVEMRAIMEEYLPLIYSRSIQFDPLVNVDYTETYSETHANDNNVTNSDSTTSNGKSNSNTTTSGLGVNSDTPQGQINKTDILAGKYASSTGANESTGIDQSTMENKATSNGSVQGKDQGEMQYTRSKKGNDGVLATAQKMVEQFRDIVEDYDEQIIEKLNVLFMGVF